MSLEITIEQLFSFPHITYFNSLGRHHKWHFYCDTGSLISLEYRLCTDRTVRKVIDFEEWYASEGSMSRQVDDIFAFCHHHNASLFRMSSNHVKSMQLVETISAMLGDLTFSAGAEFSWHIKAPKIHAKIIFDRFKDVSEQNIDLQIKLQPSKTDSKWKSSVVSSAQLVAFVKKNIKMLKEKQEYECVTIMTTKMSNCQISNDINSTNVQTRIDPILNKGEIINKHKNLFIHLSKARRIEIQTCKPRQDAQEKLLKETFG